VTPSVGQVTAAVEDDFHGMAVTLHHDGTTISSVDAVMDRAPWTTCPGAAAVLKNTFEGEILKNASARGEKRANCTHLHDLAVLAAAHAGDEGPTIYDILVSDSVDGLVAAEIRRGGTTVHRIECRDDVVLSPPQLAGASLFKLRGWVESLDGLDRESARLLQWGAILAHGRSIPLEDQSDAGRMPPNCYTFQPDRAKIASRVGGMLDFSANDHQPLKYFDGQIFVRTSL
jgi:hypothetical protein